MMNTSQTGNDALSRKGFQPEMDMPKPKKRTLLDLFVIAEFEGNGAPGLHAANAQR